MMEIYEELIKVLDIMELTDRVNVYKGATHVFPNEETPIHRIYHYG